MLEVSEVVARREFAGLAPVEGHKLLYYTQEGECAGHVYAKRKTKDVAFIAHVEVYKRFRGVGHGSKMMREVVKTMIALGYDKAYLFVATNNAVATKAYRSAGFIPEVTRSFDTKLMHWEHDGAQG